MKEASRILEVSVRRLQIWDKVSSPYRYPINRGNSSFLVFLSNFIDECRVVGLLLVNLWTSAVNVYSERQRYEHSVNPGGLEVVNPTMA